jgi:hypothetical protein
MTVNIMDDANPLQTITNQAAITQHRLALALSVDCNNSLAILHRRMELGRLIKYDRPLFWPVADYFIYSATL